MVWYIRDSSTPNDFVDYDFYSGMMATQLIRPCFKEENMEIPSIPPGFESFANSDVPIIDDKETISTCTVSTSASVSHPIQVQTQVVSSDSKVTRNLRRRSGISYKRLDDCSGDEFNSDQNLIPKGLPKGVIRGCKDCSTCQTVSAKWRPEDSRRPDLENAPIFYPTEEEFEDTIAYIASIRPRAEKYGICRIVPPSSWKPPSPLLEKNMWEESKFQTRVQRVDKLQNRTSVKKTLMAYKSKKKRRRCTKSMANNSTGVGTILGSSGVAIGEYFGFEPGPEFSLHNFEKYAADFKGQYFRKDENTTDPGDVRAANQDHWEPSVENIEGEYWRMVEKPTEEIEVLYGADLETGVFGSGFPTNSNQKCAVSDEKYVKSGWNLNNFPRLPGSVLSYESSDISGVLVPWLYIGMCFSSFCWHVEDHYLYSLNYMHWGAPKLWYGVPGEEAVKLEAAMRKHLPDLFEEQPDLLHKLVTQLSPTILKREGVPVYRCVQNPGEFVLTFPRAYHAGFNCGFNCAEAVNVAPVDWLPYGYSAIEFYRMQGRKTSISHDKLLLGAAREAVKAYWENNLLEKNTSDHLKWDSVCGSDGILSKALKDRIEMELIRRESLCISSNALKMSSDFDATDERECCVCYFDLHLSAVGCSCSPDRYTCLYHANHLCSCSWKFYLFRYDVNELRVLIEAVEGKLSAVYRWARLDLGLTLSSQGSEGIKGTGITGDLSLISGEKTVTETSLQRPVTSLKVIIKKEFLSKGPKPRETKRRASPSQEKGPEVVLALEAVKVPSKPVLKVKLGKYSSTIKQETGNSDLVTQVPQQVISSIAKKLKVKRSSFPQNDGVILLSSDESEVSNSPISGRYKQDSAIVGEQLEGPKDYDDTLSSSKFTEGVDRGVGPLRCEMLTESNPTNPLSYRVSTFTDLDKSTRNLSNTICADKCDTSGSQLPCGSKLFDNEYRHNIISDTNSLPINDLHIMSCIPPSNQKNVDQYFRQKGPRIAKVVRKISCNVEPLVYGVVHPGKFWCDSRAIFPMGFKSRVKYINVLDPTSICYYVSQILDRGLDRPLFQVSPEHCPSEIFIHVSADKCWGLVREQVNQEITKQHKLGKTKLHPLQPHHSCDGLEMFGFSSPAIIQVIEAMDKNQVCTEYWKSRSQMQMLQFENKDAKPSMTKSICEQKPNNSLLVSNRADSVFGSLLNKANPAELQEMCNILGDNKSATDQGLVSKLLNQEIQQHQR